MFYTARGPLTYRSDDVQEMIQYTQAVAERFKTRVWAHPIPMEDRLPDFPRCGPCFSKFILQHEREYQWYRANIDLAEY